MAADTHSDDGQQVRKVDEAEALRISNRIDEELRVRNSYPDLLTAAHSLILPCLSHLVHLQAEKELIRRRKNQKKDVKGEYSERLVSVESRTIGLCQSPLVPCTSTLNILPLPGDCNV